MSCRLGSYGQTPSQSINARSMSASAMQDWYRPYSAGAARCKAPLESTDPLFWAKMAVSHSQSLWQGEGRQMDRAEQGHNYLRLQRSHAQNGAWGCRWLMMQSFLRQDTPHLASLSFAFALSRVPKTACTGLPNFCLLHGYNLKTQVPSTWLQ